MPIMARSNEQNDQDELHQRFRHLHDEQDHGDSSADSIPIFNHFQILDLDSSPSNLISSPQHSHKSPSEGGWKVWTNDLAVDEEILMERRAAISNGKLKGRRLLDALESESEMGLRGTEEIYSGASSVLIQGSELRSFPSSGDDDDDPFVCYRCHSSSACSLSVKYMKRSEKEIEKKEKVVVELVEEERRVFGVYDDEGRCMVLRVWLAIFLMLFAFGVISWCSFETYWDIADHGESLIPT